MKLKAKLAVEVHQLVAVKAKVILLDVDDWHWLQVQSDLILVGGSNNIVHGLRGQTLIALAGVNHDGLKGHLIGVAKSDINCVTVLE